MQDRQIARIEISRREWAEIAVALTNQARWLGDEEFNLVSVQDRIVPRKGDPLCTLLGVDLYADESFNDQPTQPKTGDTPCT